MLPWNPAKQEQEDRLWQKQEEAKYQWRFFKTNLFFFNVPPFCFKVCLKSVWIKPVTLMYLNVCFCSNTNSGFVWYFYLYNFTRFHNALCNMLVQSLVTLIHIYMTSFSKTCTDSRWCSSTCPFSYLKQQNPRDCFFFKQYTICGLWCYHLILDSFI